MEDNINIIYKKQKVIMKINNSIKKLNKIIYKGEEYPFTQWNFDRIMIYGETKDEKYLSEMSNISLVF